MQKELAVVILSLMEVEAIADAKGLLGQVGDCCDSQSFVIAQLFKSSLRLSRLGYWGFYVIYLFKVLI